MVETPYSGSTPPVSELSFGGWSWSRCRRCPSRCRCPCRSRRRRRHRCPRRRRHRRRHRHRHRCRRPHRRPHRCHCRHRCRCRCRPPGRCRWRRCRSRPCRPRRRRRGRGTRRRRWSGAWSRPAGVRRSAGTRTRRDGRGSGSVGRGSIRTSGFRVGSGERTRCPERPATVTGGPGVLGAGVAGLAGLFDPVGRGETVQGLGHDAAAPAGDGQAEEQRDVDRTDVPGVAEPQWGQRAASVETWFAQLRHGTRAIVSVPPRRCRRSRWSPRRPSR